MAFMAFRWRVDVGPTLKAGLVALRSFRGLDPAILLRNPIFFVIFQGGGRAAPTLDPLMASLENESFPLSYFVVVNYSVNLINIPVKLISLF